MSTLYSMSTLPNMASVPVVTDLVVLGVGSQQNKGGLQDKHLLRVQPVQPQDDVNIWAISSETAEPPWMHFLWMVGTMVLKQPSNSMFMQHSTFVLCPECKLFGHHCKKNRESSG